MHFTSTIPFVENTRIPKAIHTNLFFASKHASPDFESNPIAMPPNRSRNLDITALVPGKSYLHRQESEGENTSSLSHRHLTVDDNNKERERDKQQPARIRESSLVSYWDWSLNNTDTKEKNDIQCGDSTTAKQEQVVLDVKAKIDHILSVDNIVSNLKKEAEGANEAKLLAEPPSSDEYWSETVRKDIDADYFVDYCKEIGRGHKTVVRKCINRKTGERFAMKSIRKLQINQVRELCTEASVLKTLNHPNIVQFYELSQDDKFFHSVMELCKGGELYALVLEKAHQKKRSKKHFLESEIATILQQVLDAVAYCHSKNIMHRDLKLENIVLCDKKSTSLKVKLIDFGLATRIFDGEILTQAVGTNYYVAPEVLRHNYSTKADVWSVGVIAYALFSSEPPFVGNTNQETYDKILSDQPILFENGGVWGDISHAAKDFVKQCLEKDASKRPSAAQLQSHEWFLQQHERQKAPFRINRFKKVFLH